VKEAQELQIRWLERLAFGPSRTEDQLVQLWLGLFPVSWRQVADIRWLEDQMAAIRANLQGSYTDLLQAMVRDRALQTSLNGLGNRRKRPNENLARELLELFSLGEGNYSERDVSEAARALTGYRRAADGKLFIDPKLHDDSLKSILAEVHPTMDPYLWLGWPSNPPPPEILSGASGPGWWESCRRTDGSRPLPPAGANRGFRCPG